MEKNGKINLSEKNWRNSQMNDDHIINFILQSIILHN